MHEGGFVWACVVCSTSEGVFTCFCMWWSATRELSFLVQFRNSMGRRLDRGPNGFLCFGSAIKVPLPRESNATCCSDITKMMLARVIWRWHWWYNSTVHFWCLNHGHVHFWQIQVLLQLKQLWLVDWLSGRGLPMNGSSHSPGWSENCFANHSWMASALPWSVPINLPSRCEWSMVGDVW